MKILFFTDVHTNKSALAKARKNAEHADLAICLGDVSEFTHGLRETLKFFDTFPCPVITLHGNHEDPEEVRNIVEELHNVTYTHEEAFMHEDILFLSYGGQGFVIQDASFDAVWPTFEKAIKEGKHKKLVLLTHQPPFNTKLDLMWSDTPVGNMSIRMFIDVFQPQYAVSGHLHEHFHERDTVKKTVVLNPGPDGELVTL